MLKNWMRDEANKARHKSPVRDHYTSGGYTPKRNCARPNRGSFDTTCQEKEMMAYMGACFCESFSPS